MPSELPVWYIQAGIKKDGKFVCISQGSAVLVAIRRGGEAARKVLVTAQHVLRSGTGQRSGTFHPEIRAWVPGKGFNDATAVTVTLLTELSPKDTSDLVDDEDFAFLDLATGTAGAPAAKLVNDADCKQGISGLTVSGYPKGEAYIATHGYIIDPSEHPDWRYTGNDPLRAIGILAPGDAPPREGVSGGGVFFNNAYAGVYRGEFSKIGEHLFLPITRLREWCSYAANGGYTLLGELPPEAGPATSPLRRTIISDEVLVLDRETFREHLEKLISPSSLKRIILVRGTRGSGKSHGWHLFNHAAEISGAHSVYLDSSTIFGLEGVLDALFSTVGGEIPPAFTTDDAWYSLACNRLADACRKLDPPKQLWIAMDDIGYNEDGSSILDPAIRAFFNQFALQMSNPAFSKWFRLLLIHYPPGTPTRWKSAYWTEDLATAEGVQLKQVKDLLLEWCANTKRRFIESELDAQAADVISQADAPSTAEEASRPRLERLHDLVLKKLEKLQTSHT